MPKNRLQETIYTVMMVVVMVYAMICYNVALSAEGMGNFVFLAALSELPVMGVVGFVLDTFIAGPVAKKLAFRLFDPTKDKMLFVILAISVFSIWLMCPMMSFVATVLFKGGFHSEIIATWVSTTIKNFPMAFFWQLFVAGPLIRTIFGKMFPEKQEVGQEEV